MEFSRREMRGNAMTVMLQDFEPQTLIATKAAPEPVSVRKPRLRLNPVVADNQLFHAL
jgi:hypothetical protein